MNQLVRSVADLCSSHPVTPKVVFASSRQDGQNIANAILRSGQSWLNLRTTTPLDHAATLVQLETPETYQRLPGDLTALVILQILSGDASLKNRLLGAETALSNGVLESLDQALRVIRFSNVDGNEETQSSRRAALMDLAGAYELFLAKHEVMDDAALLRRGAELVHDAGNLAMASTALSRRLTDLEDSFVTAVVGHSPATAVEESVEVDGIDPAATVDVRYAIGQNAESVGVVNEILSSEISFDHIEIAYTKEDGYLSDLASIDARLPGSLTFANGTPVLQTNPGRALIGYFKYLSSGRDSDVLKQLLRSRTISVANVSGVIGNAFVARKLDEFRAGAGHAELDRVVRLVEREAERFGSAAPVQPSLFDSPGKGDRAYAFRTIVNAWKRVTKSHEGQELSLALRSAIDFLQTFAPVRTERDGVAIESLVQRLESMLGPIDFVVPISVAYDRLGFIFSRHKISASVARPGRVSVVPLEKAGLSGRSRVFVLGMDDESFPGEAPDSFFSSLVVGGVDRLTQHRQQREAALYRLLQDPSVHVTLVSQRSDPTDGSEIHPSPILKTFATDGAGVDYFASSNPQVNVRPEFGLTSEYSNTDYADVVALSYPWMHQGALARQDRKSNRLTSFDGILRRPTPELDLANPANVVSASAMERLSGCPYRYFLSRVLRARVPERPPDEFSWLSSLQKGRLLHDLLQRYFEEGGDVSNLRGIEKQNRLRSILDDLVKRMSIENPPHNSAGYERDMQSLILAAEIFLAAEEEIPALEQYALELRFGFKSRSKEESTGPMRIYFGGDNAIALRGAIDRVDRLGDSFYIWDYKSGSTYNFAEVPLRNDLRHMQWTLYAYALEEILKARKVSGQVVQSGYFFISEKGNGQRVTDVPLSREEMGDRISPLLQMVAGGTFVHAHRERNECRFCDYKEICGNETIQSQDLKDLEPSDDRATAAKNLARKWLVQ